MSINYDFGDLEAFLAVKDTGSFHKAGAKLNLSQSAITRRIRKLEDALDSQLFVRTTRSVKPTLAAKRLQARAEALLEDARETSEAMRDESVAFAYQRNALLTVAVIPTVIERILLPALQQFRDDGYSARVRILDVAANEVADAVAEGEADFGISSIPSLEATTQFEPLFEEQIVVALPKNHPLADSHKIGWNDLREFSLILPSRGTGNRVLIDEALARARQKIMWNFEVLRTATSLEMVKNGLGVALIPESAMVGAEVVGIPLRDASLKRSIGILRRTHHVETSNVKSLIKVVKHLTE